MTNTYVDILVDKYRRKGVIVDTNLLLLWLVGLSDPKRIKKVDRTEKYSIDAYRKLNGLILQFSRIITTPNIITEISNLINDIKGSERESFFSLLGSVLNNGLDKPSIETIEEYVPSTIILEDNKIVTFGVTDCGIRQVASQGFLVLTDDASLIEYLRYLELDAVNFSNLFLNKPYVQKRRFR